MITCVYKIKIKIDCMGRYVALNWNLGDLNNLKIH